MQCGRGLWAVFPHLALIHKQLNFRQFAMLLVYSMKQHDYQCSLAKYCCFQRDQPLNLVIMSATLRVEDFTENRYLFPVAPPVVKVGTSALYSLARNGINSLHLL